MIPNARKFALIVGSVFLLTMSSITGADQQTQSPPPSPSAAPVQTDERWKKIELWRNGQKAYAEKKYAAAFKELVEFKAANQEIFSTPPKDLESIVKEISDAITYSQMQLVKSPVRVVSPDTSKDPVRRPDGIHIYGHPGVSGAGGDKGTIRGAHDDVKSTAAGASKDKRDSDKGEKGPAERAAGGASVRERP